LVLSFTLTPVTHWVQTVVASTILPHASRSTISDYWMYLDVTVIAGLPLLAIPVVTRLS